MGPSGPPTPIGGAQSVMPSFLGSNSGNSGMLGGQGGQIPSQGGFSSLVSPRAQFNNGNLLGNGPNVASLMNHSFSNGNINSMIRDGLNGNGPRGSIVGESETNSLSGIGNGIGFNPQSSIAATNMANPSTSGQVQGQLFSSTSDNHMLPGNLHWQQLESQNSQRAQLPLQQFSANQQSHQSIRGGLGGSIPMKLEPQGTGNQHGNPQQQQLQSLRGLGQVKLESQHHQNMRSAGSIKMEPQQSDQSLFLLQQQQHQQQQQQQQHQQLMQQMSMPRQSPHAAAATQLNLLQQQKILQLHQQQQHQHQLLKSIPQQRSQSQTQFSPQNVPLRSPVKKSVYEPGMCARRLTHYMYQQQHRPEDNNIEFWRKFVAEYFAPNAKKKWCVSMYGSSRQTTGVFPQDVWHCEICKHKPGRGFEATVEVLPRLFKIKYESGTVEELLYVDMPREYQNSCGQIVLDYAKAIQESVFDQLRVVRDGQLRIVFSTDLKICSWEFCARRHEELIPRRLLIPQVTQLGTVAQKYQASTQNSSSNTSVSELQTNCNMFVASARQLAKTLEVPLVNDLGYTKRYVRCLQISEVVNSMKDLIDHSRLTGAGPMASLAKFSQRTNTPSALQEQNQQPEQPLQQAVALNSNSNNNNNDNRVSSQDGTMQVSSTNGVTSVNNRPYPSSPTSHSTIAALLHQNSMNSRQQNPINNTNGLYGAGSSVQILSPAQQNPSPLQSPTLSSSNNPPESSHSALASPSMNHINPATSPAVSNTHQPAISGGDTKETQSSVQKYIQGMTMNSNQLNGGGMVAIGSLRHDVKNVHGTLPNGNLPLDMPARLVGNGPTNNNLGMGPGPFFGMGQGSMVNGNRATMGNNSINGRVGIMPIARDQNMNHQPPEDLGSQILGGLGAVNGFDDLQFDWKSSP